MKTFLMAFGATLLVIVLAMPVAAVIMTDTGDEAGSKDPAAAADAWVTKRRTPPAFRWWFKKHERPSTDPTTAPPTGEPADDDAPDDKTSDDTTPDDTAPDDTAPDDVAGPTSTTTTTSSPGAGVTTTSTTVQSDPDDDPAAPPATPPSTAAQPPAPGNARFVEDFAAAGSLGRFDFAIYHRDDFVNADNVSWPGDHAVTGPNDLCGPPEEKRTITRGDRADGFNTEWIYRCVPGGDEAKAHIMTSIGDTSGYSIGGFAPKQTFQGISEIRWDVNITELGNRQFPEVKVIPADVFDFQNLPCSIEWLPCDTDTHGDLGSVGASFNNHEMSINNGTNNEVLSGQWGGPWFNADDAAVASIRTRRTNIFRDNGDGTLTYAIEQADGSFHEVSRPGRFPSGAVRVVFADHNYTPLKAENGRPETFSWHWDNILIN